MILVDLSAYPHEFRARWSFYCCFVCLFIIPEIGETSTTICRDSLSHMANILGPLPPGGSSFTIFIKSGWPTPFISSPFNSSSQYKPDQLLYVVNFYLIWMAGVSSLSFFLWLKSILFQVSHRWRPWFWWVVSCSSLSLLSSPSNISLSMAIYTSKPTSRPTSLGLWPSTINYILQCLLKARNIRSV